MQALACFDSLSAVADGLHDSTVKVAVKVTFTERNQAMLLRKTKIFCNGCQRASVATVPVASEQDEITQESLTCARPGHDLGGRKAGLRRNDVSLLELTYEKQSAAASLGYGAGDMKVEKQPDMTAWQEETNRRVEEIEAARPPQPTPEQAQMAKDVTKRIVDRYPRPDAQP